VLVITTEISLHSWSSTVAGERELLVYSFIVNVSQCHILLINKSLFHKRIMQTYNDMSVLFFLNEVIFVDYLQCIESPHCLCWHMYRKTTPCPPPKKTEDTKVITVNNSIKSEWIFKILSLLVREGNFEQTSYKKSQHAKFKVTQYATR